MGPPLAFVLSLIAFVRGQNRGMAIAGMVISGLVGLLFLGLPLIRMLCR